jgi:putative ABC transport system permease protein
MEAELDDELKFHLERQCEKYIQSGLTPEESLRRVRLEFGGAGQVKEECRDARGIHTLEVTWQDARYASRTLRNPAFTCVALLTVALGIGANTAIFSVVHAVLLRPLPYSDPDRLIVLNETTPRVGAVSVSYPNFLDWRAQNHAFSAMVTVAGMGFNLAGITQPETIVGEAVSTNFLSMMGVRPILGRDFDASEDKPGAAAVAMISYPLWQSHFGGQHNVIGRHITLDGRSFPVIAVLPPGFRSISRFDVLVPVGVWLTDNDDTMNRGNRGETTVVGRLAPGVSLQRARAEMEGIAARLATAYPESNDRFGVIMQPIRELFVGDVRAPVLILFAAVLFVLIIACANVANLFLMRSAGRTREIALRIALGATRGRIVRQMLAESSVVAFFGGIIGLGLAAAGIQIIARFVLATILARATVNLNGAVLAFAAFATVVAAIAFGLALAMQSARSGIQSRLMESGKATTAGVRLHRWRSALVVTEIALSVILLAGAGLMLKSLYRLLSVDPGFQPDRLLKLEMSLSGPQYQKSAILRRSFWQQVLDRVRALPGVESAAFGTAIPLTNEHSRTDMAGLISRCTMPTACAAASAPAICAAYPTASATSIVLAAINLFRDLPGTTTPSALDKYLS